MAGADGDGRGLPVFPLAPRFVVPPPLPLVVVVYGTGVVGGGEGVVGVGGVGLPLLGAGVPCVGFGPKSSSSHPHPVVGVSIRIC